MAEIPGALFVCFGHFVVKIYRSLKSHPGQLTQRGKPYMSPTRYLFSLAIFIFPSFEHIGCCEHYTDFAQIASLSVNNILLASVEPSRCSLTGRQP